MKLDVLLENTAYGVRNVKAYAHETDAISEVEAYLKKNGNPFDIDGTTLDRLTRHVDEAQGDCLRWFSIHASVPFSRKAYVYFKKTDGVLDTSSMKVSHTPSHFARELRSRLSKKAPRVLGIASESVLEMSDLEVAELCLLYNGAIERGDEYYLIEAPVHD